MQCSKFKLSGVWFARTTLSQVSHHPPVSALHATNEKENLELVWCQNANAKFHGRFISNLLYSYKNSLYISWNSHSILPWAVKWLDVLDFRPDRTKKVWKLHPSLTPQDKFGPGPMYTATVDLILMWIFPFILGDLNISTIAAAPNPWFWHLREHWR